MSSQFTCRHRRRDSWPCQVSCAEQLAMPCTWWTVDWTKKLQEDTESKNALSRTLNPWDVSKISNLKLQECDILCLSLNLPRSTHWIQAPSKLPFLCCNEAMFLHHSEFKAGRCFFVVSLLLLYCLRIFSSCRAKSSGSRFDWACLRSLLQNLHCCFHYVQTFRQASTANQPERTQSYCYDIES